MKKILTIFLLIAFCAACKESYDPPIISTDHAFLVVEGFINNGPDSTVFSLSHSYKLADTARATPEPGAQVTVEGSDNSVYPLGEMSNGNYGAGLPTLNAANSYRLHIVTAAGKEYRSDFVPLKVSPPIDSVNWKRTGDGVQIYANTHDPQNASTYYLWSYSETWQFHSVYFSQYQYQGPSPADTIVVRSTDSFYTCWKTQLSTNILLGSSAKLGQDLIYEAPMELIPNDDWRISVEYSINVKQIVLTPQGYTFWLNLQRNTEQIGSVFSPQPSEIKGNIHSLTDTKEQVIGFISAGTLQQKRLFIQEGDLSNWTESSYTTGCTKISIIGIADSVRLWLGGGNSSYLPVELTQPPSQAPPFRYNIAEKLCVDCTQVGTNHKPSFWP